MLLGHFLRFLRDHWCGLVNFNFYGFHRFLDSFELHTVNVKVFKVSEDFLLASDLNLEFTLFVAPGVFAKRNVLSVRVTFKLFFFVGKFGSPHEQQQVEQVLNGYTWGLIAGDLAATRGNFIAVKHLPQILK